MIKSITKAFTVINHYDLNSISSINVPFAVSDEKICCCWPCTSEPIVAKFSISKSGYVSGESIFFNSIIENNTKRKIKPLKVKLVQNLKFYTKENSQEDTKTIAEIQYTKNIESKTKDEWNDFLLVPSLCPTSSGLCKIIDISYMLVLTFVPTGFAFSTKLQIPIVIG